MKKIACLLTVVSASLLSVQAGDSSVQPVQPNPWSSKKVTLVSSNTPEKPLPPVIPPNLREQPAYNIPFPEIGSGFKQDPDVASVHLGAMPDVLQPMGAPVVVAKMDSSHADKTVHATSVELPARAVVEIPQATEKTPAAGVSQETVTVSPFLDWIQNTKNAAEIARQQRQAIEQSDPRDKTNPDGSDQDLFVHIRFPYVGNQDVPPSGGSVTYSVPQR